MSVRGHSSQSWALAEPELCTGPASCFIFPSQHGSYLALTLVGLLSPQWWDTEPEVRTWGGFKSSAPALLLSLWAAPVAQFSIHPLSQTFEFVSSQRACLSLCAVSYLPAAGSACTLGAAVTHSDSLELMRSFCFSALRFGPSLCLRPQHCSCQQTVLGFPVLCDSGEKNDLVVWRVILELKCRNIFFFTDVENRNILNKAVCNF